MKIPNMKIPIIGGDSENRPVVGSDGCPVTLPGPGAALPSYGPMSIGIALSPSLDAVLVKFDRPVELFGLKAEECAELGAKLIQYAEKAAKAKNIRLPDRFRLRETG